MIIKGLIDEDFINYKKPSMTIEFSKCSFKCDKESGLQICQNSTLAQEPDIEILTYNLVKRYINNPITKAVICQGLEPFDTPGDLLGFIISLREECNDDIVIYTGYNKEELERITWEAGLKQYNYITYLKKYPNIIIKYGRFIPNRPHKFDEILGVELASDNQYAEKIS